MFKFENFNPTSFTTEEPTILDLDVDFFGYDEYESDSSECLEIDYTNQLVTKEEIKKAQRTPKLVTQKAQTIYEIKLHKTLSDNKKIKRTQSLIIIKSKLKSFFTRVF